MPCMMIFTINFWLQIHFLLQQCKVNLCWPSCSSYTPIDAVWLREPQYHVCCQYCEECCCNDEDWKLIKWINKFHDEHPDPPWNWLSSPKVTVKIQPIHLQSLFQRKEMILLNFMNSSCQSIILREQPPYWMRLLFSLKMVQLLNPKILTNLTLNIFHIESKFGGLNLGIHEKQKN